MPVLAFTLLSPLRVKVSKTKYFALNLNIYRNAHFHTLNKAKVEYKNALANQILALPDIASAKIHYTVYPRDKRSFDVSNVVSIHQKFFEDALVELGKLPDDSISFIKESSQSFGEVSKNNPRVEITITATIQETDMQIILDREEIKEAIIGHIKEQGIDLTNATVEVGMTAGRGLSGPTATVDIIPKGKRSTIKDAKPTYATVTQLPPATFMDQAAAELDEETLDPEADETEGTEEAEEEAPATNSIFK